MENLINEVALKQVELLKSLWNQVELKYSFAIKNQMFTDAKPEHWNLNFEQLSEGYQKFMIRRIVVTEPKECIAYDLDGNPSKGWGYNSSIIESLIKEILSQKKA